MGKMRGERQLDYLRIRNEKMGKEEFCILCFNILKLKNCSKFKFNFNRSSSLSYYNHFASELLNLMISTNNSEKYSLEQIKRKIRLRSLVLELNYTVPLKLQRKKIRKIKILEPQKNNLLNTSMAYIVDNKIKINK